MKYTKAERLDIGHRVYNGEMTVAKATEQYGVSHTCIENYIRLYRKQNNLPPRSNNCNPNHTNVVMVETVPNYSEFESMSREELIGALIRSRINEERAKKGYTVKGDGTEKVFEPIVNKNTK